MAHAGGDDFAEDVDWPVLHDRAVPASMSELMLTLVDRQPRAVTHPRHVLGVPATHAPLPPCQRRCQPPTRGPRRGPRRPRGDLVVARHGVGAQVTDTAR